MVEMSMLEACIRDDLNVNAPRAMAVLDPIKVIIENFDEGKTEILTAPNHPSDDAMGTREIGFSREVWIEAEDFRESANKKFKRLVLDKEVRLRNAYVIKANRVEKDAEGNVTTVYCTYDADTLGKDPADGRKVKGVIHWVDAATGQQAEFRLYDRLFNVPNPAAEESFTDAINPDSLDVKLGWVEKGLAQHVPDAGAWQFERTGYFCLDTQSTADKPVFNRTVGLRDTWAKNDG
jgi:glutaminyl-tRNA synthetase